MLALPQCCKLISSLILEGSWHPLSRSHAPGSEKNKAGWPAPVDPMAKSPLLRGGILPNICPSDTSGKKYHDYINSETHYLI